MLKDTNLFKHAPKELVLDAFLTWLLYFLDSDPKHKHDKITFFADLLLKPEDVNKDIQNIKVERQEKAKVGRADMKLTFKLGGEKKIILFENKTWSATTKKQLEGYKNANKNEGCTRYLYLKLAYINCYERKLVEECDYEIIDVLKLSATLEKIKGIHFFVEHYLEFLNRQFKDVIVNDLQIDRIKNDHELLEKSQVQQYVIVQIYQKLDGKLEDLKIKVGSSFGRAWTQLDICIRHNTYGTVAEYVFWRLDKRSGRRYIRLNQYANIAKDFSIDIEKKKDRLSKLRRVADSLSGNYNMRLGTFGNRGIKESEIMILFLEDQKPLDHLLDDLVKFSLDFCNEYKKI